MRGYALAGVVAVSAWGTAWGQGVGPSADVPVGGGVMDDSCVPLEINGVLGSGAPEWPYATGTMTGRLTRDGNSSTCGAAKACPGVFTTSGSRRYDAYTLTNTSGSSQCVRFLINGTGGGTGVFMVGYTGTSFNPANALCTSYAGDCGSSSSASFAPLPPMDLNIPSGGSVTIVVHETDPASGTQPYRLYIQGFPCNVAPNGVLVSGRLGFANTTPIWAGVSGVQTGRMLRNGVVSSCSAVKSCPGDFETTGVRRFDRYPIFNPYTSARCVSVRLVSSDVQVFGVAYSGDYDPANRCTNYLADIGQSSSEIGREMSFNIPARGTVNLIFHEVEVPSGSPDVRYAFSISGLENPQQASSTCYANCDLSTVAPILNVNDFICFLNKFAAGCTQ